jgi:hypothetical protein
MECRVWPARDLCPRTLDSQPPIPAAVNVPPVHVGGKMYWPREPWLGTAAAEFAILTFDVCTETFEVVPAPPALLGDVDIADKMVLVELAVAGKLCAANLSTSMETMTVWGKNVEGWGREHVIELQQWPEFSPRTTELAVMPMAVDPVDGRMILLDTGMALGTMTCGTGLCRQCTRSRRILTIAITTMVMACSSLRQCVRTACSVPSIRNLGFGNCCCQSRLW